MLATVASLLTSTVIGSCARPLASACCSSRAIDLRTVGAFTFAALTTTLAAIALPGNAFCIWLYAFTAGSDCGNVSGPSVATRSWRAGNASATSKPPARTADRRGRRRTRSTIEPQIRPSPSSRRSRPTNGTRSRSTLSPSLESSAGRTVSEPSIAVGDHGHRGETERGEGCVTGQEHAGHRHHDGQPGDEHRAAGGCRGGFDRRPLAATGGPFLSHSLQVEHRVVDAYGEADEEHDCRDLVRQRQQVAGQGEHAERREDGCQREEERNAGGDERSEGDQQDDQRDRNRQDTGLCQVLPERVGDGCLCARFAELADEELRVSPLRHGDPIEDRLDLVGCLARVAANVELDERRMAVLCDLACVGGSQRRTNMLNGLQLGDRGDDIVDRGGECGIARLAVSDSG